MRKQLQSLFVALAAVALMPIFASCEKDPQPVELAVETITLTATMEQPTDPTATKTALGGKTGDITLVNWTALDAIKVFAIVGSGYITSAIFTLNTGEGTISSTFIGTLETSGVASLIAYYPAANATSITVAGALTVTLPATQRYVAGSFGNGAAPMVAYASSGTSLNFKNICGMVKLSLTGTQKVKSIVVSSRRLLCGVGTVTYINTDSPKLTLIGGINEVTLDCSNEPDGGVQLNASIPQDFYMVVPPTAEGMTTNDFIVQVITTDGTNNIMTKEATAMESNKFVRSNILKMPSFVFSADAELYYVQNGVKRQGITISGIIWAPVNCGYEPAGDGGYKGYPYGKLYQWGRKYGQGYDGEYDASFPSGDDIVSGPTDYDNGQKIENACQFYKNESDPCDWLNPQSDYLWNSGTETAPVKTDNDPCPAGWRVPTYAELIALHGGSIYTVSRYFVSRIHGETSDIRGVIFSNVFLPASGVLSLKGLPSERGDYGHYWSSAHFLTKVGHLSYNAISSSSGYSSLGNNLRALGYSVRCVKVGS